jgi:hypothetical protein
MNLFRFPHKIFGLRARQFGSVRNKPNEPFPDSYPVDISIDLNQYLCPQKKKSTSRHVNAYEIFIEVALDCPILLKKGDPFRWTSYH